MVNADKVWAAWHRSDCDFLPPGSGSMSPASCPGCAVLAANERAERAEERLAKIRPMSVAELQMLYRQQDVIHEARRLSEAVGEINTTRELDAALKRYDAACAAVRESA